MRIRTSAAALVVAAATMAGALASIGPAQAATSANGCTVDAVRPQWQQLSDGRKQVRAAAYVTCNYARSVNVQIGLYEADTSSDDLWLSPYWKGAYSHPAGVRRFHASRWVYCKNTEAGSEEPYTKVRIASNSSVSAWDSGRGEQLSIAC